jgi:ubiquinone/menaquinone biosynthesis C-methylase UbiE
MEVLDCGCGPGTITAGLARAVMPGRTVGIDTDDRLIAKAQAYAAERDLPNLRFETASIYELPFADDSFDAVYSNAVLTHLSDPLAALREMHRVLKSGGVAGIRNYSVDGCILAPIDPGIDRLLARFIELQAALIERNGGNPYLGKQQRALLRQAGFVNVQAMASFDHYGTAESTSHWATVIAGFLGEETGERQLIEYGLSDRDEVKSMRQAWMKWAEHPDAFYASAYGEAVGWKK